MRVSYRNASKVRISRILCSLLTEESGTEFFIHKEAQSISNPSLEISELSWTYSLRQQAEGEIYGNKLYGQSRCIQEGRKSVHRSEDEQKKCYVVIDYWPRSSYSSSICLPCHDYSCVDLSVPVFLLTVAILYYTVANPH